MTFRYLISPFLTRQQETGMKTSALARYLARLPSSPNPASSIWMNAEGRIVGQFHGCHLSSVFQPIRELASGRAAGIEAFIRSLDPSGSGLSPWSLFAHAASDEQLIDLDRLCRTIHALTFLSAGIALPLFLNVHGRLMVAIRDDHGRTFRSVLDVLEVPASRFVIESPEVLADEPLMLALIMHNYRRNGYGIAVNLARVDQAATVLSHLRPDYLKIDAGNLRDRAVAASLAALARDSGAQLIVKRLANRDQHRLALDAGVALAQGLVLDVVGADAGRLLRPLVPSPATPASARPTAFLRKAS